MTTPELITPESEERAAFRRRLGTYALGVGVGCVLVGVLWLARWQAHVASQAIDAEQQRGLSGTLPGTPANPGPAQPSGPTGGR